MDEIKPARPSRHGSGGIRLLVFSLIPVLLLLAFGEAWARWRHLANAQDLETLERGRRLPEDGSLSLIDMIRSSSDPNRVFEPIPNISGIYLGHPYRSNSFGMRDEEVSLEKGAGVFRIAAVGDSYMWGWHIPTEATYPSLLESYLNASLSSGTLAPTRYEVLNFSVPGYNTVMEAAAFEAQDRRFEPDLVLLGFCSNDLSLPNFVKRRLSVWSWRRLYLPGYLADLVRDGGAEHKGKALIPAQEVIEASAGTDFDPDPATVEPEFRRLVGFEACARALETFGRWRQETGRPVLHVFFRDFVEDVRPWHTTDTARLESGRLARVQRSAESQGLVIVDSRQEQLAFLGRHPEASPKVFWTRQTDTHPSRVGQIALFKAVYRTLVEEGYLPDRAKRLETLDTELDAWDRRADQLFREASASRPWALWRDPLSPRPRVGPGKSASSDSRRK